MDKIIYIAHRGNINGSDYRTENTPKQVQFALDEGWDVEIDVWYKDGKWWFGHDRPEHEIDFNFLHRYANSLWIHCKNIDAVSALVIHNKLAISKPVRMLNFFWHQTDDVTLTSMGYVWTYPGKELGQNAVAVCPERVSYENPRETLLGVAAICSDNIEFYKRCLDGKTKAASDLGCG